jgi:molybdopterin synthase catalytic subunit
LTQNTNNEIAVRVLFFGAARDAVGRSEVDLVLKDASTAASAFAEVLDKYPDLRRFGRSLLFAVNQEYVQGDMADRAVREGDELAVFPPVSGGSAGKRGPHRGSPDGVLVLPAMSAKREN